MSARRWDRMDDDFDLNTAKGVVHTVEALRVAAGQAASWTQPGTCHAGTSNANPCQQPHCIESAVRYSGLWAYEAAHQARRLFAMVEAADPMQRGQPDEGPELEAEWLELEAK